MINRKNYVRKEANPEEKKKAEVFISSFFAFLKAERFYPIGHKLLVMAMERFYAQLKDVIAHDQKVSLRIFDNNLYFQNFPLDSEKIPDITSFLEKMHERYIRRIVFNTGTNIRDIDALIALLKADPDSMTPQGGANSILEQNGAKNIKIIEYYNKSRVSINQERLKSLTDSSVFQFFTDDSKNSLSSEQAYSIYDLLKETPLICSLIKNASQDPILKQTSNLTENANILEIIKKIKAAIDQHNISEKTEIKSILHDIIASNSDKDFFDLVFEHQDDEIINYTNVSYSVFDKLGPQKTADFLTEKITEANGNSKVLSETKSIINKLFKDRKEMLDFLPTFKDTLQKNIPSESKSKEVINYICSSIDPELSLEIDAELSLGFISENEESEISEGLDILKNVHPVKETMIKRISSFDQTVGYFAALEDFIEKEKETKLFVKMLGKLIAQIEKLIKQNKTEQAREMLIFFFNLNSDSKELKQEHRQIIFESLAALPDPVLKELVTKIFNLPKDPDIKTTFNKLFYLFPSNIMPLLINCFISSETFPKKPLLREIIINNYKPDSMKYDVDLKNAPVPQIVLLMDLFKDINSDDMIPFLWEITFRENISIAKRSLKLIASKKSDKVEPHLFKAVNSDNIPLRITGIECLGLHNTQKTRSVLEEISQGKKNMTDSILENIDIRIAALKSLEMLDSDQARRTYKNIMEKKKFIFINAEHKKLREFAAIRLKKFS